MAMVMEDTTEDIMEMNMVTMVAMTEVAMDRRGSTMEGYA